MNGSNIHPTLVKPPVPSRATQIDVLVHEIRYAAKTMEALCTNLLQGEAAVAEEDKEAAASIETALAAMMKARCACAAAAEKART